MFLIEKIALNYYKCEYTMNAIIKEGAMLK